MKPLCVDLFCGLGGWAEGFLAEGYEVVGFDIERHRYPARAFTESHAKAGGGIDFSRGDSFNGTNERRLREAPLTGGWDEYPGQLVLQDVRTIHGSQFRNAACIVASPPCQEFSYMAMPWKRGKQIAAALRGQGEFPEGYRGSRTIAELTALFDACFRIQREACEAAGRYIPLVVENVKGAQPWVGQAGWSFGSFYLWGDMPALMPKALAIKNGALGGGSWFAIGSPGQTVTGANPDGRKVGTGDDYQRHKRPHLTNPVEQISGVKGTGGSWYGNYQEAKAIGRGAANRYTSSKSPARKAASAQIAKIPFPLANWIARVYQPQALEASA